MNDERYAFEKFPRGTLVFTYNRRELWSALRANMEAVAKKAQGGAVYTLADLGDFPDEQIAEVTPIVVPDCQISERDGFIWGQAPNTPHTVCLFPSNSPALAAFNLFNGINFVCEASAELATIMNWDPDHSFAYTRGLFLALVTAGICQPKY